MKRENEIRKERMRYGEIMERCRVRQGERQTDTHTHTYIYI